MELWPRSNRNSVALKKAFSLFTSAKSSVREAGYKSANLLLEAIDNPNQEKQGILLEAELTIGSSTKRYKPAHKSI